MLDACRCGLNSGTNGGQSVSAEEEHDLNTNQTSFTAGFIRGPWETVPSRFFAMVTGDSFQRCHAALSSHQLIHSPPPSGSLAFVPFLFRPFNLQSARHPGRKTSPHLATAQIIRPRDGSASRTHARTQQFAGHAHTHRLRAHIHAHKHFRSHGF